MCETERERSTADLFWDPLLNWHSWLNSLSKAVVFASDTRPRSLQFRQKAGKEKRYKNGWAWETSQGRKDTHSVPAAFNIDVFCMEKKVDALYHRPKYTPGQSIRKVEGNSSGRLSSCRPGCGTLQNYHSTYLDRLAPIHTSLKHSYTTWEIKTIAKIMLPPNMRQLSHIQTETC